MRQSLPALVECADRLYTIPQALTSAIAGLQLRVPQTMMLAAYPPNGFYRRHLDSYNGEDIPRKVTVLLYLLYQPQQGGHLRCHLPAGPLDIAPLPGRVVVFWSQEVEHEVLPSHGERAALTLWVWDMKKDSRGR